MSATEMMVVVVSIFIGSCVGAALGIRAAYKKEQRNDWGRK